MNSDLNPSSFSSSSPMMAINDKDNNPVSLNDVVAVSKGEGGFLIGKVTEQRNDSFILTLYHYKLDTRTHLFKKNELIMNFGHVGSRTIFEMAHDQQRALLSHLCEPDHYSSSLLAYIVQIKQKDEARHEMVKMITDLLGQLTITDDGLELLCKALKDNIFDDNEFMEMICVTAVRVEDNILLDQLADVLAKIAFEKKTLEFIQNKILNDPSAVQFLKKCLWKIGKRIGQMNVDNFDQSFAPFFIHYTRLSTSHCES